MGSMTGRSAMAIIAISTSVTLLSLSGLQAQGVVTSETTPATTSVVAASVLPATTTSAANPNTARPVNSSTPDASPNTPDNTRAETATTPDAQSTPATQPTEQGKEKPSSPGKAESNQPKESNQDTHPDQPAEADQPAGSEQPKEKPTEKPADSVQPGEQPTAEPAKPSPSARSPFRQAANALPSFSNPKDPRLSKAVFAVGGSGRFKENILWLQWKGNAKGALIDVPGNDRGNPPSLTQHNYHDLTKRVRLVTSCTISNLHYRNNRSHVSATGPLEAWRPGNYWKDFLPKLYTISDGIITGIKNAEGAPHSTPTFNLNCTAQILTRDTENENAPYTHSVPFDIDGLVISDAESAGFGSGVQEFIDVKTTGATKWYVLDEYHVATPINRSPSTSYDGSSDSSYGQLNGDTLRILPNGKEAVRVSPGAVLFAQGVSSAEIKVQGNGFQAVGMGLVVPADLGDAPRSYGEAIAIHHPNWDNPLPKGETNLNLHPLSSMQSPKYTLGTAVNAEKEGKYSDLADADQADDGLDKFLKFDVDPGEEEGIYVKCRGDGGAVAGWIDWNLDGDFDPQEKSTEAPCQNTVFGWVARIHWTVPQDVLRVVDTENFVNISQSVLRLRIVDPAESTLGGGAPIEPTGVTLSGEVEDHGIHIYAPTLRLITEVIDPDGIANALRPATDWKVKAVATSGAVTYADNGSFAKTVRRGKLTISTESALPTPILDYTSSAWTCGQSQGAVSPPRRGYTATFNAQTNELNIPQADHVTCTIQHRPIPGELAWHKVDAQQNVLADSQWRLIGPSAPNGLQVKDCKSDSCTAGAGEFLDTDKRPGYFRVTGLKWGSYALTETHAPPGYVLDSSVRRAEVTGIPLDLGAFVNVMHRPLVIPLTGGTASIFYVVFGGGLIIAAFVGAAAIGSSGRSRSRA
ncbi:MAG: CshA/CshB family fibrillar adhesin-related protein [Actinomycetaceae bacterium]|nr:CshA/CshB family fibrillar adhesin-related protein [Actinomycetaceae bacterium]